MNKRSGCPPTDTLSFDGRDEQEDEPDVMENGGSTFMEMLNYEAQSGHSFRNCEYSQELANCLLENQSELTELKMINAENKSRQILPMKLMLDKSCGNTSTYKDTGAQFALQTCITLSQYTQKYPDIISTPQQTSVSTISRSTQSFPHTHSVYQQTSVPMYNKITQSVRREGSATKATSLRPAYLQLHETSHVPEITSLNNNHPKKQRKKNKLYK